MMADTIDAGAAMWVGPASEPGGAGAWDDDWRRLLVRWWRQSLAVAQAHPRLVGSWASIAAGLTVLDASALALEAWLGRGEDARRAVPGVVVSLGVIHADTFVHLNMNAAKPGDAPFETLGLPAVLTLLRRTIAGFLWAHLIGRRPLKSTPALAAAMAVGSASDVIDGAIARGRQRATRLGAYLDAEADFSFWTALALTLGARKLLPRWLIALLVTRFVAPAMIAGAGYIGLGRQVQVGSTIAGKAAAVAQLATCGMALAPRGASHTLDRAHGAVHVITAGLLLAAPLAQAARILRAPRV
jgi:phosphatidylglycerophosphate synthase